MSKSVMTDLDFGGVARLRNLPAPASNEEPVRLADMNAAIEAIKWKDNCVVVAPANVNLASPGATIGGVKYDSEMPAFADMLGDADIANIIDYERSAWGNHGKLVTAKDVAAVRAKGK